MKPIPGPRPAELRELTRVEDRVSFVYLERCKVHRADNAITATDLQGVTYFPSASVAALMLGPGTNITHQAMVVLADSGSTVIWVGEHGVRYYAHGRPLARTARLQLRQADLVSNQQKRLGVARSMYEIRFPDDVAARATMQQLRGKEGARVRRIYREMAERYGVEWRGRDYAPGDFEASDPVNRSLTGATACLYGLVHAVIVGMGVSPALGFIHTGNDRSFVYDIADLYKMEYAVPVAFEVAGRDDPDPESAVRLAMRDMFKRTKLLTRVIKHINQLLGAEAEDGIAWDVVELWDGSRGTVAAGHQWDEPSWEDPEWSF